MDLNLLRFPRRSKCSSLGNNLVNVSFPLVRFVSYTIFRWHFFCSYWSNNFPCDYLSTVLHDVLEKKKVRRRTSERTREWLKASASKDFRWGKRNQQLCWWSETWEGGFGSVFKGVLADKTWLQSMSLKGQTWLRWTRNFKRKVALFCWSITRMCSETKMTIN